MATVRVVVLTHRPGDLERARKLIADPIVEGRVVVGDADEDAVHDARETGLLVTLVDPLAASDVNTDPAAAAPVDVYMMTIAGPLLNAWREAIVATGAELLERVQPRQYTVRATPLQLAALQALDFVWCAKPYTVEDTFADATPRERSEPDSGVYDVRVHKGVDAQQLAQRLGLRPLDATEDAFRIEASGELLRDLAALPEVAKIREYRRLRLSNDLAMPLVGLDRRDVCVPWTGRNEKVGIADSGVDTAHPDLQGRVTPRPANDPDGHGTHVAGCIAGDGSASNGDIVGAAPDASLVVHSLSLYDDEADLGLSELTAVLSAAYAAGARVYNLSFCAEAHGRYLEWAEVVDRFAWEHPDMLIVVAAGNYGTAASADPPGIVEPYSLGDPSAAKNALTVGASANSRVLADPPTWGGELADRFPRPPVSRASITGDPNALAAASSRGPCADDGHRMKPDIVAPGTFIKSARSPQAPATAFQTPYPANHAYGFMTGTSVSAPIVAGSAAVARQYLREVHGHEPSAALLKAVLINGTRWLEGYDAVAGHPSPPNWNQGFGCLDVRASLPDGSDPLRRLVFRDTHSVPDEQLATVGDAVEYALVTQAQGALRLCLVWTDPPGKRVQNSMAVILQDSPAADWARVGNETRALPDGVGEPATDTYNNVQIIRCDDVPAGTYRLIVVATNKLHGVQPFAVCATGPIAPGALLPALN